MFHDFDYAIVLKGKIRNCVEKFNHAIVYKSLNTQLCRRVEITLRQKQNKKKCSKRGILKDKVYKDGKIWKIILSGSWKKERNNNQLTLFQILKSIRIFSSFFLKFRRQIINNFWDYTYFFLSFEISHGNKLFSFFFYCTWFEYGSRRYESFEFLEGTTPWLRHWTLIEHQSLNVWLHGIRFLKETVRESKNSTVHL